MQELRLHVPPSLDIETTEGTAWVSAVAFRMARVRPRFLPPFSPVSNFLELNLRTYVRVADKPGVYFFSIHGSKALAVAVARLLSPLPYVRSRMSFAREQGELRFASYCQDARSVSVAFSVTYQPKSLIHDSSITTLDTWLTERYCMYVGTRNNGLLRGQIHHKRWPLQEAQSAVADNSLGKLLGVQLSCVPDRVHYCAGIDAIAWSFERVTT